MTAEPSRAELIAEADRARETMQKLVETADRAALHRRSNGTRWTNQQLLFHMLFGYLLIRRLRPLVLLLSRLPAAVRRGFAATLNAATRPFHVINYLGSAAAGTVLSPRAVARWTDTTIAALDRRIANEAEENLDRTINLPAGWDPYFRPTMTMRQLYHYATQHFDHHQSQLTL
jgi:hypothetical protein